MRGAWQQPLPDMPAPPPARAWRRLDAPPGYEAQWRRLAEAALELGLGPDQLSETGAFGHPEIATAEKGESLFAAAAEQVVAFVREFARWPTLPPH